MKTQTKAVEVLSGFTVAPATLEGLSEAVVAEKVRLANLEVEKVIADGCATLTCDVQSSALPSVAVTVSSKKPEVSTTPNMDQVFMDPKGRGSVEYAKARNAINLDFRFMFEKNQALAKSTRKRAKREVVAFLKGVVTRNAEQKLIVTFPDQSVAWL